MATRLFIALYLDADVSKKIAEAIRAEGFDAIAAVELGQTKLSDEEHLEFAQSPQRAILTHNHDDFARLFDQYWRTGKDHYGIIVSEQLPIGIILKRLLQMLDTISAEEMKNSFRNLGEFK